MALAQPADPPRVLGRYLLCEPIASGGMATVHVGRLLGPVGFSRTVAIKRLKQQFADDPGFVAMFLDEARVASRIRHPNVVATLDVVSLEGEIFLVMDYVRGVPLTYFLRHANQTGAKLPVGIASHIAIDLLRGLHAAHEATSEAGAPLDIVHRDMSPQNVLVGADGAARIVDFGIAKASGRLSHTRTGEVKGKLAYMAPEQLRGGAVDRRVDVFAAGIVLWEMLTARRLFAGATDAELMYQVLEAPIVPPSTVAGAIPTALDAVVMRALSRDPAARFATAEQMALAIEAACPPASVSAVSAWVNEVAASPLREHDARLERVERLGSPTMATPVAAPPARGPAAQASTARWLLLAAGVALVLIAGAFVAGVRAASPHRAVDDVSGQPAPGRPAASDPPDPPTPPATSAQPSASASGAASAPAAATAPRPVASAVARPGSKKPAGDRPQAASCAPGEYYDGVARRCVALSRQ